MKLIAEKKLFTDKERVLASFPFMGHFSKELCPFLFLISLTSSISLLYVNSSVCFQSGSRASCP